MRSLHDAGISQRCVGGDEEVHLLAGDIGGRLGAQVASQPRAGNDAIALFIEADGHHDFLAGAHGLFLFAERQEQILGESPVQKCADARVHADDVEAGKLADFGQRFFRGGHEPVFGVAINKNVELVAGAEVGGDVASGQENFAERAAVEIQTGSGFADDGKKVAFAEGCHDAAG